MHKNVPGLLRAYAAARATLARGGPASIAPRLALVGTYPHLEAAVRQCCPEVAGDVVCLGHVGAPELASLYRAAALLLFPSTVEGFGLPPLEAMALGCPVVASNAAALPEVVGDAGMLCAPSDVAAQSAAICRVLLEPELAGTLRRKGLARAGQFSWEETARRTLQVYEDALN